MPWQKSPATLIQRFDEVVPRDPRVERRKMFGYPAAFVNGRLFSGLFESSLILKLSPADRAGLPPGFQARMFEPMPGRAMRDFVALPESCLPEAAALARWLERALDHVAHQPPKRRRTAG